MKKILLGIALAILFTSSLFAEYQEYGRKPTDWKVFTKEKGEISNYFLDGFPQGITFSGNGMKTGYKLNLLPLNKGATTIRWSMKFNEFYAIYIEVSTTKGKRTLRYTSLDKNIGKKGGYINFGLGSVSRMGQEYHVDRDLKEDLERFEAGNKILSITSFMVRGSGIIHNIRTTNKRVDEIIIGDAGMIPNNHWSIYTSTKGTITTPRQKQHIKLSGKGMETGYKLSFPTLTDKFRTVRWDMQYSENYAIYFLVTTSNGVKYLRYSSLDYDKGIDGKFISFGLGSASKDGKWHSFRRNLQKDLNKFEPNSKILSINAFMIRGSGMVNNIKAIRDSSLIPIQNFNMKKFNELLKEQSLYGLEGTSIHNTSDEHIKYIYYAGDHITFYTLSSDQTYLRELAGSYGNERVMNIKSIEFNSSHTKMTVTVENGISTGDGKKIFEYEILL